jgi:hypothetical protein
MLSPRVIGIFFAAAIGAAFLMLSITPASAFTLSLPSIDQALSQSQVELAASGGGQRGRHGPDRHCATGANGVKKCHNPQATPKTPAK